MQSTWILYVDRQHGKHGRVSERYCAGSSVCMQVMDRLGMDGTVAIQDCHILRMQGTAIPAGITGTPSLFDRTSGDVYIGTDALVMLCTICSTHAGASAPDGISNAPSRPSRPDRPDTERPPRPDRPGPAKRSDPLTTPPPPPASDLEFDAIVEVSDTPGRSSRVSDDDVQKELDRRNKLFSATGS